MRIRKKPVTVNGWRISELLDLAKMGAGALPQEVRLAYGEGLIEFEEDRITIATLEGVMTGWASWWLICGVKGEWYPCDTEAFDQSYDIVEPEDGTLAKTLNIPSIDPYASSPEL